MNDAPGNTTALVDTPRLFWLSIAGAVIVFAAAVGVSHYFAVPLADFLPGDFAGLALGVAVGAVATLPLVLALLLFMQTNYPPLARFRSSQIDFLNELGFELTPFRIVAIGLAAGISEEMLFRGALQSLAERHLPMVVSIVAPNIIFGLLHARTTLYAIIAGVLGVYLGVIFALTGSLAPPIATHAIYDMAALAIAKRYIDHDQNLKSV
ncbi:MAG: CPBP family intramembrane metalloprotease [Alphaproteobacteria bacterium]|nr:CPBP family intramembrane metalloprotease [Alphaproteobacteria bacterium]